MNSSCPIHLVALPPDSIPAPTHFDFQFPPERIVLGDPGKTAGDILLIRDQHQSRVLVSLGPRDKAKPETWRKAGGQAGKWLRDNPPDVIDLDINLITMLGGSAAIQPFLEGLRLGSYTFNTYKTKEKVIPPIMVRVNADDRLVDRITILTEAVMFSRDLAHEPANVINPITFAHKAQTVVAPVGLKIQVLDEQELDAIGAGAILSVGKGSQTPPRLIIIEYQGAGSAKGTPPRAPNWESFDL
jgi:leucyl aminopeptidase